MRIPWLARVWQRGVTQSGTVSFGRKTDLVFVIVVVLAIPWVATLVIPLGIPFVPQVDPDKYWLLQTLHQVGALALTLLAMRAVSIRPWAEWGLNLRNAGQSILLAIGFAVIVSVPTYFLMDAQPRPTSSIAPAGVVAVLVTHFVVIGTTQEVLYRGFAMGFLESCWPETYRAGNWELPLRGILAAVIFMVSHVKPHPPFVWPAQLVLSLGYGLLYAVMYQRTKSLLGPSLAHGYSNTAFVAMLMLKHS